MKGRDHDHTCAINDTERVMLIEGVLKKREKA